MKRKIGEIIKYGICCLVGMIIFMLILITCFYIQISYFDVESTSPSFSIEEQIRGEQMIF